MSKESKQIKVDKSTYDDLEKYKGSSNSATYNDAILNLLGKNVKPSPRRPKPTANVPRFVIEVLIIESIMNSSIKTCTRKDLLIDVVDRLVELKWDKEKPVYFETMSWRAPLKTGIDNCIWRLFKKDILNAYSSPKGFAFSIFSKDADTKVYSLTERYQRDSVNKNMQLLQKLITPKIVLKNKDAYRMRINGGDLLDDKDRTED